MEGGRRGKTREARALTVDLAEGPVLPSRVRRFGLAFRRPVASVSWMLRPRPLQRVDERVRCCAGLAVRLCIPALSWSWLAWGWTAERNRVGCRPSRRSSQPRLLLEKLHGVGFL